MAKKKNGGKKQAGDTMNNTGANEPVITATNSTGKPKNKKGGGQSTRPSGDME